MIGLLSKVKIIDNSGALEGRCIKVLKPGKSQAPATIGDIIVLSVIKISSGSKILKGDVLRAIVVRVKHNKFSRWSDNAAIVISAESGSPLGTRIKGPVSTYIKNPKILTLTRATL